MRSTNPVRDELNMCNSSNIFAANRAVGRLRRYLTRGRRAALRRRLRACLALGRTGDPYRHFAISNIFVDAPLGIGRRRAGPVFPGITDSQAETCVRQKLLATRMEKVVLPALMCALHQASPPITASLPLAWRQCLLQQGVRIRPVRSRIAWFGRVALLLLFALARAGRLIWLAWSRTAPAPNAPFDTIIGIGPAQLPRGGDRRSSDFVTSYRETPLSSGKDGVIWAVLGRAAKPHGGSGIICSAHLFPSLGSIRRRLAFTVGAVGIAAIETLHVIRGDWWRALLLDERIHCAYLAAMDDRSVARIYVFNSYGCVVRPLWTYVAAQRGARTALVFVSTNFDIFGIRKDQPRPFHTILKTMSWSLYGIWDQYQGDFLDRLGHGEAEHVITGAVGFTDSPGEIPDLPENTVAVFDVLPRRVIDLANIGVVAPYYLPKVAVQFIDDVIAAARRAGFTVVIKQKRELGRSTAAPYRRTIERHRGDRGIIFLNPEISAHRLVRAVDRTISMPFTSTAIIGRELNTPSVYYDPSGELVGEPGLAHGVPILAGVDALAEWLTPQPAGGDDMPANRRLAG